MPRIGPILAQVTNRDGGTDRVQHNGHVTPVEPRSSFSSAADGDTLVHCDFDCGPPQPRKHMINKGNARSVCWVCNPCYSAMRAIIRSWSATPESKAMLDEMRCKDKLRWHALVRQCRIRPSTEEVGLADLRTRKKAVLDATQSMVQAFGVQDTADVFWLTKPRYIANQIYVEGIEGVTLQDKEAAAAAKWTRDFANADVVRRGTGPDTQLGVSGVPRTQGYRYRESLCQVTCSDSVHTNSELDTAMRHLADHGTTAQALTGRAMGEFGSVFMHGAASSSSDTLQTSLPARSVSAPPVNVLCDPTALAPQPGFTGKPTDSANKRETPRSGSPANKRAKGGVTGRLLDMRNQALAAIKKACHTHGIARSNPAKRWEALRTAGHVDMASVPPDMESSIRTFTELLDSLKLRAKKDVATWTLSCAARRSDELDADIDRLDNIATSILARVVALEDRAKLKKSCHGRDAQSAVRADSLVDTMAVCGHRARGTRAFSTHAVHAGQGHARHRPRGQKWRQHGHLPRRRLATHGHATVGAGIQRRRTWQRYWPAAPRYR